jgi:TusA-related sulfurtransferase
MLDLRGERCPVILQRVLLALDDLPAGVLLEVWLNYPPAVAGVPRSLEIYRHHVISLEPLSANSWKLVVQKGEGALRPPAVLSQL